VRKVLSGGGDLFIKTNNSSCVVVGETIDDPDSSPIYSGIQQMAIEGKRGDDDMLKLKHQLFANLIAATTSHFIQNIQPYKLQDILRKDFAIAGYGIPYTGSGIVGFFKLKIQFDKEIELTTKLEMKERPKDIAAALMDYLYDIYFTKLHVTESSTTWSIVPTD